MLAELERVRGQEQGLLQQRTEGLQLSFCQYVRELEQQFLREVRAAGSSNSAAPCLTAGCLSGPLH